MSAYVSSFILAKQSDLIPLQINWPSPKRFVESSKADTDLTIQLLPSLKLC
jgi:hypothetical protein